MLIPSEAEWWLANQNRTQRVQIVPRRLAGPEYDLLTQDVWSFVGSGGVGLFPQYQSPTFPSSQPVVLEWATAGITGNASFRASTNQISAIGVPTSWFHSMRGDPLTEDGAGLSAALVIQWSYQGQVQSQIVDINTAQLAIGLADWVSVYYVALETGFDSFPVPLVISVYPNARGQISTARITLARQSLHNGVSPTFPVGTWARVARWRWFWGQTTPAAPGGIMGLEVVIDDLAGGVVARWLDLATSLPGTIEPVVVGISPLLAFDRWEPWVPNAWGMRLQPIGVDLDWALIVGEIRSEV